MKKKEKIYKLKLKRLLILLLVIIIGAHVYQSKKVMLSVPKYNQHPNYPTGCESASLYMLLKYYEVDVTMEEIVKELPKGPLPYKEGNITYGANPEREFVGDPKNANSYGVYNEPIRKVAEKFKSGAKSRTNASLDDIYKIISNGNPVMAWFTSDINAGIVYKKDWLDYKTKDLVKWPSYEHAIVITGFNKYFIYYNDPNTGKGTYIDKEIFMQFFNKLDGRIVYYDD